MHKCKIQYVLTHTRSVCVRYGRVCVNACTLEIESEKGLCSFSAFQHWRSSINRKDCPRAPSISG